MILVPCSGVVLMHFLNLKVLYYQRVDETFTTLESVKEEIVKELGGEKKEGIGTEMGSKKKKLGSGSDISKEEKIGIII